MKESSALCMYSYVVFSVQKTWIEQELITSAPEMKKRGESQKIFMSNFEPVRGLIDIQQLKFCLILFLCVYQVCKRNTKTVHLEGHQCL